MEGVWIAPVTAQVMITFRGEAMRSSWAVRLFALRAGLGYSDDGCARLWAWRAVRRRSRQALLRAISSGAGVRLQAAVTRATLSGSNTSGPAGSAAIRFMEPA